MTPFFNPFKNHKTPAQRPRSFKRLLPTSKEQQS
jgi:hypothetical protein